tara:strand:- start:2727 stop:3236 length:510 start_codon:yes stop_codon:yes gene_type:complete
MVSNPPGRVTDNYHVFIMDKSNKCIYDPAKNQQFPKQKQAYWRFTKNRDIPSQSQIIYRPWSEEKQQQQIEWLNKALKQESSESGHSLENILHYAYARRFNMEGGCGMLCQAWLKFSPKYNKKKHRLVVGDVGFKYRGDIYWVTWDSDDEEEWRPARFEDYNEAYPTSS